MNYEVFVHRVKFPNYKTKELITESPDGNYTVLIDERLDDDSALKRYYHALNHIENGDLDTRDGDVQKIEIDAHHD
jgi:hypothetical protein